MLGKVTVLGAWRACVESVRALDRSDSRDHQRQCADIEWIEWIAVTCSGDVLHTSTYHVTNFLLQLNFRVPSHSVGVDALSDNSTIVAPPCLGYDYHRYRRPLNGATRFG